MCWTSQQKLLHDMKVVDGNNATEILLNIMATNDNKKVEEILEMVNDIGVEESWNVLNNQISIKKQQYDNVSSFRRANNTTELRELLQYSEN